jgi:hypothetical protein
MLPFFFFKRLSSSFRQPKMHPLESIAYELPNFQVLLFDIHPCDGG